MATATTPCVLILTKEKDQYAIILSLKGNDQQIAYSFSQDFLPEKVLGHVHSLDMFNAMESRMYLLTEKQEETICTVLRKLIDEEQSNYVFSEHLQKNHLIQLIHLITKIHLARPVVYSLN